MDTLHEFQQDSRMTWRSDARGWLAQADEVVDTLSRHGYQEYKREVVRSGRDRKAAGGMWQGLNIETGSVASVVWVSDGSADHVTAFIDIDGQPLVGG
jgi:hypothetical protein